jgi:hypothetical protein
MCLAGGTERIPMRNSRKKAAATAVGSFLGALLLLGAMGIQGANALSLEDPVDTTEQVVTDPGTSSGESGSEPAPSTDPAEDQPADAAPVADPADLPAADPVSPDEEIDTSGTTEGDIQSLQGTPEQITVSTFRFSSNKVDDDKDKDKTNSEEYWEEIYGGECTKIDPPDTVNEFGELNEAGNGVVLFENDNLVALIIKAGDVDHGDGPGNRVINNPVPGTEYLTLANAGGDPHPEVSHWTVCVGTPPELDEPEGNGYTDCEVKEGNNTPVTITNPNDTDIPVTRTIGDTTEDVVVPANDSLTTSVHLDEGESVHVLIVFDGNPVYEATIVRDCEEGEEHPDIPSHEDGEPYWECVPGQEQADTISFLRTYYKSVWNGSEYGDPVPTGETKVITIPKPDGFDAPCEPVEVTPVTPTYDQPTCEAPNSGKPVVPEQPTGITYTVSGDTVTFATEAGYVFPAGFDPVWHATVITPTGCGDLLAFTGTDGDRTALGAVIAGIVGTAGIGALIGIVVLLAYLGRRLFGRKPTNVALPADPTAAA